MPRLLHLLPGSRVLRTVSSARRTAADERRRRVLGEFEAGARPAPSRHSTVSFEAAGRPDDRQRAVAQAVQLIQPHGSKRDGIRNMSEPASMQCASRSSNPIVADTRSGIPRRQVAPQILVAALAAAEHHPRRVERHQLVRSGRDQIEALLIGQPRHQADDRPRQRVSVVAQTGGLEQRLACAVALPDEIVRA